MLKMFAIQDSIGSLIPDPSLDEPKTTQPSVINPQLW